MGASIWLKKLQRFSLMLLLSGLIVVQFMQIASAARFSFDDHMSHCGSVLAQNHDGHDHLAETNDAHNGQNSVCDMTSCQAFFVFVSDIQSPFIAQIAADPVTIDGSMFSGPFLPQIGKPPKHN
ncbi:hypothetical protein GFB49_20570 [Epibacterium sp. SM1979]|uniref:DUF2946 domain-containing protein n=1 Tax=Tritonibacter litoralis TaxID=2662264 RepID=A0A843YNM7_9RHOB|nr:hypothetical protein [Tritonibacter litoralis]MQQ10849.1 hypothetical protein [Tritonibacter litoralis]